MDPAELAATATSIIVPYLAKAGEAVAREGMEKIWGFVQSKFQGKPASEGAAQELTAMPEDPDNQEAFSLQLKKALKEDPAFAEELTKLIKSAQESSGAISNTGSGAVATGGGVAAGAGGIAIGGNVGGSVVFGSNNTVTGENKPG